MDKSKNKSMIFKLAHRFNSSKLFPLTALLDISLRFVVSLPTLTLLKSSISVIFAKLKLRMNQYVETAALSRSLFLFFKFCVKSKTVPQKLHLSLKTTRFVRLSLSQMLTPEDSKTIV